MPYKKIRENIIIVKVVVVRGEREGKSSDFKKFL